MDYLHLAKKTLNEDYDNLDITMKGPETWAIHLQMASTYAAIAQAEALRRIADYMEGYAALYLDPAIVNVSEERLAATEPTP